MAAVTYAAFEGRIVFHVRHASIGASQNADQFEQIAKTIDAEFAEKYVWQLSYFISLTPQIDFMFHGDENPMLTEFKDFWEKYQKLAGEKAVKLAIDWYKSTHPLIPTEWNKAIAAVNMPYRDPVTAPYEQLTPEQKAEADDPQSFLADNAANLQKAS